MTEQEIIKFREKAISYFQPILLKEGYGHENNRNSDLAFYIAKILEDAYPLIQNIERIEKDTEKVFENIHLLYSNLNAFEEGHKILMLE